MCRLFLYCQRGVPSEPLQILVRAEPAAHRPALPCAAGPNHLLPDPLSHRPQRLRPGDSIPAIYRQESDLRRLWEETSQWSYDDPTLQEAWNREAVYCETDFLRAATAFLDLPIEAALGSDDPIIRILAILDRWVGRRTLQKIRQQAPDLPPWVRQFYDLRLSTM